MNRAEIFIKIDAERSYQEQKWGNEFDNLNTPNDWVSYLTKYLGKSVNSHAKDCADFRGNILKVATMCVAILEREQYAPRHYDAPGA